MRSALLRLWLTVLLGVLPVVQAADSGLPGANAPAAVAAASSGQPPVAPVVVIDIDGAIEPASAERLKHGLARARALNAQLLVLRLDTPGGLDSSMRAIVKEILASPVPFASYVTPSGARAASAGTYLLYASHVAAMAPATNLGAATPVAIGMPGLPALPSSKQPAPNDPAPRAEAVAAEPMSAKRLADAAAYLRSLAQLRGRNAEWAERAVRESVSLSAREALELRVIDLIATDLSDLLRQLDGRSYDVPGGPVRLDLKNAPIVTIDADWRSELLSVLANPSLALILLLLGIYGLIFEFANPGFLLPGVAGAISLLLGLFALQALPINHAGLALIVLGLGFMVAEAFVPSFGALGFGGIVAFAVGMVLLINRDVPGFAGIPYGLIALLTLLSAAFVLTVVGMAVKARRRPVVSGAPTLLGQPAEIVEFDDTRGEGWALLAGVHWRVRTAAGSAVVELIPGAHVAVRAVRGNTLEVAPLAEQPGPASPY